MGLSILLAFAILVVGSWGDLLSYWKFDESSGDVAYDSAGSQRHFSIYSNGVPKGPYGFTNESKFGGHAFYFAGNYANVTIGSLKEFTLSFWMKSSNNHSVPVGASVFEGQGIVACDALSYDWTVSVNKGKIDVGMQDASTNYYVSAPLIVNDADEWHYVVVRRKANMTSSFADVSIFIDNIFYNSMSMTNVATVARPCTIGATLPQQLNVPYGGILDEMRIYNYSLNATEMLRDFYGNESNPNPPAYYWKFDEPDGNTAFSTYGGLDLNMVPFFAGSYGVYGFTSDSKYGSHAYSFIGHTRYVGVKADVDMPSLGNLTFSFWMKSSTPKVAGTFSTTPAILNCDGNSYDWTIYIVDGSAAITMSDDDGIQRTAVSNTLVNDGAWHFVACVRLINSTGSLLSIYVDNVFENSVYWTRRIDRIGRTCMIAANVNNNNYYSGLLDEMRLYSHAQTPAEINADYQNFAVTTSPLTTQPLTTQELTTSPLTTSPLTTSPLSTSPLTTSELTTNSLTTSPLTTDRSEQPATTQPLEESSTSPERRGSNGGAIAGGIIAALVVAAAGVIAFIIVRRRRSRFRSGDSEHYIDAVRLSALRTSIERSPSVQLSTLRDIEIKEVLGRGNFGEVYLAEWQKTTLVAMKKVLGTMDEVLQEASILSTLNHPNVIRYLGVYLDAPKESLYVVMEYLNEGSLDNWIRRNVGKLTTEDLTRLAVDAAAGMRYLEEKGVIHRDLALRNLLIGKGGPLKVADFGLSRMASEGTYVVTTKDVKVPVKWTAPEAIEHQQYSHASDAWSFGVMLWELFSYGQIPYNMMSNGEAMEAIKGGYRLECPKNCPPQIYRLMLRCWHINPKDRPTFAQIHSELRTLIPSNTQHSDAYSSPSSLGSGPTSMYNLSTEI